MCIFFFIIYHPLHVVIIHIKYRLHLHENSTDYVESTNLDVLLCVVDQLVVGQQCHPNNTVSKIHPVLLKQTTAEKVHHTASS